MVATVVGWVVSGSEAALAAEDQAAAEAARGLAEETAAMDWVVGLEVVEMATGLAAADWEVVVRSTEGAVMCCCSCRERRGWVVVGRTAAKAAVGLVVQVMEAVGSVAVQEAMGWE
jgi:hypothetical protein